MAPQPLAPALPPQPLAPALPPQPLPAPEHFKLSPEQLMFAAQPTVRSAQSRVPHAQPLLEDRKLLFPLSQLIVLSTFPLPGDFKPLSQTQTALLTPAEDFKPLLLL